MTSNGQHDGKRLIYEQRWDIYKQSRITYDADDVFQILLLLAMQWIVWLRLASIFANAALPRMKG